MAWQRPTRLVMGPCIVEIDRIVIRDVQYKFEVIPCRNEEVNCQGSSAYTEEIIVSMTDGQTDGQTAEITTISPRFSKSPHKILRHIFWTSLTEKHHYCRRLTFTKM
ncbi:hypothetical protein DPMN_096042 [Dreissena polymorpha]|uniref:Uncharacterized protein n=1 Tax=Dreissena polymorpha TaxID=45954 RepID=A0A9D4R4E0_DREPO|nr:hypothetical protein DPMN_096042 [Dreissena polymorpha]